MINIKGSKVQNVGLNDYIKVYLEQQKIVEEKERLAKERAKECKKKYKDKNCMSMQVFLEKELVVEFKKKVKESGMSQAEVLRNFMKDYIKK